MEEEGRRPLRVEALRERERERDMRGEDDVGGGRKRREGARRQGPHPTCR